MALLSLFGGQETRPSVGDYLSQRCAHPDFIMVEFGHELIPVAHQQPFEFRGRRAYIGVEAWLREPCMDQAISKLRASQLGQNIFFITHNLGGAVQWDDSKEGSWYEGQYDATTELPALSAREVLASNVFGDPHIAEYPERTDALLRELARLADMKGKIIIRETVSPQNIKYLDEGLWHNAGLTLDTTVTPDYIQEWYALERIFNGEQGSSLYQEPESFYMLLSKIPTGPKILTLL
jgi:hypothetical protein